MATLSQVIDQMAANGLPALPAGHPVLDGKVKRFGPKKKAWYVLREITLRTGTAMVTGAFGIWQGTNQNAIPVTADWSGVTPEERAEAERKQAALEAAHAEKKARAAELAAQRARMQWGAATAWSADAAPVGYLVRKQVPGEGARISPAGELLIPMRKHAPDGGVKLVGLQKIRPDGEKRFSTGMDKAGSSCRLGAVKAGSAMIGICEGFATGQSVRVADQCAAPLVVAFDAGNLLPVAKHLREDFPSAHLVFFADDDAHLEQRFRKTLQEEFGLASVPPIDGADHRIANAAGELATVRATWRKDSTGTDYIELDVRAGRSVRMLKIENAGLSKARAAAAAVGNASVVWPQFTARGDNTWSDFNDLQVEESIEAVRAQVTAAFAAARAAGSVPAPVSPPCPPVQKAAEDAGSPPPPVGEALPETSVFTLEWALAHCALVQGSTDVWDSINKLRMRRPAFVEMVGKDAAKVWSASAERRSISPRNLPKIVRGVAVERGAGGADDIVMMLDRYTLLYGTKTVWDAYKRVIIGYDAMSLARGSDLATRWIEHPMHREIDLDKLVFDPTQKVDLTTHINMFEGFPLKPNRDERKARLALSLLYTLCSSEPNCDEVFKWVLSWLAYPLQHPGAKMQTALLFFGEKQGTGKSLFFEGIVKPIYGLHGATGGQHQLEAQYTQWRSQKLFVLFEEILSRQDKYSHFGLIKHMITGRDMPISQKFKDDRTEANHMNVVMLSNEFQAVPIEAEDRRFQVVEARIHVPNDLMDEIKAELKNGLSEAFYAFLLDYPLDGFNPHTKPLMTASKERMISFGRPDWEAFYLAWAAGDLNVPYCSCLSTDLYFVYSRYCSKFGFRTMTLTKFGELIAQRVHKDRQWVSVGPSSAKKLLTVFHVPQPEGAPPESLSKQCERFRNLADIKEGA